MRYLSFVRTLIDAEDRGVRADQATDSGRLAQETSGQVLPCMDMGQAAATHGLLTSPALRIRFRFPSMPLFGRASFEREYLVLHPRSMWPMKSSSKNMRSIRGSAALNIILVVLVLAAIGIGAWWFFLRTGDTVSPLPVATSPAQVAPGEDAVAPADSSAVEGLSIDQLYREARKAMGEQRLVAPAGNNALEFYLAILQKDATNAGASDALRELFPFASGTAEQEINQGDLDEATRIIESLAKADPSNYTLTILRSKMDAKRKQVEQQEAQAAAAAAAPPPSPAATPAAGAEVAETASATTPSSTTPAATNPAASTRPPAPTPAPAQPAPVAAAPQGETRDVEVVTPVAPTYPPQAARNREEGWVEVEFTVTAEGKVTNASVAASNPPRTFDREAVRSIERTKFSPRIENGVPVNSIVRRRIEFKLGR